MRVRERDRRASEAGGFVVDSGSDPACGTAEALVVLADGSVWRAWSGTWRWSARKGGCLA